MLVEMDGFNSSTGVVVLAGKACPLNVGVLFACFGRNIDGDSWFTR